MTNDESRAQFPNWKVEIVTKAFSTSEESSVEDSSASSEPKSVIMNKHTENISCDYIDINDNLVNKLLCGIKDHDKESDIGDTGVIPPSTTKIPCASDLAKARSKIVDYDITKDSDSERSSSGASTPEKRDSLLASQGKTDAVQADQVHTSIVDIEDSDSSDDSDLLTLTLVRNVVSKVGTANGVTDGARIVQEILNEVVANVVEIYSLVIVQEILKACLERIDYSKDLVEKKKDIPSLFGATDIRYRKDGRQVVKNNALSVVIISPHSKSLSSFHDDIKKITSRARYEGEAASPDVVRMDFVFTLEKDRVALHEEIKKLVKPPEVYMETKAIPHNDLSYRDSPTLTEEQMLHVWHDNKSFNIFSGFDIELSVQDDQFSFNFKSMSALSLFLYCTLGIEKAFLGKVKQLAKLYEPLKLTPRIRKKDNAVIFPLKVKYTSRSVDLASLSQQFKCKLFDDYRNKKGKPISVTLDFVTKKDLYGFLTSPEARAFKEILYS